MKIKCPGCSAVLNVPDAAAGKLVKCPCGKQLRAPGGAAKPAAASAAAQPKPQRPAPQAPAARPAAPQTPTRQRPAPQRPASQSPLGGGQPGPAQPGQTAAAGGGFDGDLFDELTDQDLGPVKAVAQPGQKQAPKTTHKSKKALAAASADLSKEQAEEKSGHRSGAAKQVWSSIGILLFLGVANIGMFTYWFVNAESEAEAMVFEQEDAEEDTDFTLTLLHYYYGAYIAIGVTFVVCALLIFQFPMTCSITALVVFIIGEIIPFVVVGIIFPILLPFMLFSIRDWVRRVFFCGALLQAINNASYYKFVKTGGREK